MNNLLQTSKVFIKKNASTILTCVGGAGVVGTAVMAVKATPKALERIETAEEMKGEKLTKMEAVQVAGPVYIPAVITGAATLACIFGANTLNKNKQAALMSAYALLDNSYKEYKNKVNELYGEGADQNVRAELAKDKYDTDEHKDMDENTKLYYDDYSERYFEATTETMLRMENEINRKMAETEGVYLNEYFELVGLERTDYGDYMGWSSSEMYDTCWTSWFDLYKEKVIMDDGLECTIIRFVMDPTFDFENYY